MHGDKRLNVPTADAAEAYDYQPEIRQLRYPRNPDLDPQLVWRGKDNQHSDLLIDAPPIYIQEKIDPRVLVENLRRTAAAGQPEPEMLMFEDFDGLDELSAVEFYEHSANWSNRMILGDSLQVMASLTELEDLRGQVQMVYIDPPYGIRFGSNWQPSARSRTVRDGSLDDASRDAEQIKAFRDTWAEGIHSYLPYLRDRLTAARDLLTQSGSCFLQIGDENVHLVRSLMDEVMGRDNFVSQIAVTKSGGGLESTKRIPARLDYILWYAMDRDQLRYRPLYERRADLAAAGFTNVMLASGEIRALSPEERAGTPVPEGSRIFRTESLTKPGPGSKYEVTWQGRTYTSGTRWWGSPKEAVERLLAVGRVRPFGNTLRYIRFLEDFDASRLSNLWDGLGGAPDPVYVVQTNTRIIERCMLMSTSPGDIVLDPTSGSGTTAFVAEQWARRWITIDTSRVALALARQRLMGARYPYYMLLDSHDGRRKEAELTGKPQPSTPPTGDIRQGFVHERLPRITLASIANNPDIRNGSTDEDIEAAIARHADFEILYDRPFEDRSRVRVTGRFTIESLTPHRSLGFSKPDDGPRESLTEIEASLDPDSPNFEQSILDNLAKAGIQNGRRQERIVFASLDPYPGVYLQAVGQQVVDGEGSTANRVGIALGPQYGTVSPAFIKAAAREAVAAGDVDLVAVLAFAFDAQAADVTDVDGVTVTATDDGFATVASERRLGRVPVLLVRMNVDLLMGENLRKSGTGNLFTVFGEPDIDLLVEDSQVAVRLNGVDVFDPTTGEVRSNDTSQIALWMIDTSYNGESFFVRHAYFTGGNDPYKRLKAALKADIDEDAWATLYRTESRPFERPATGKIAVKVINDYGDEVMKVFDIT